MIIPSILQILAALFSLWESKEKTKYADRVIELKKMYWEEWNKPRSEQSDAALDNIAFELKTIMDAVATLILKKGDASVTS